MRLVEGRFEDSTTYHDDPLEAARSWVSAGARYLHVVDLDGARSGEPKSLEHLRRIVQETGIPVQYGGGLRTVDAVRDALRAGAERAVVGTAAFRDVDFLDDIVGSYGSRIVIAVDVKDGMIATEGWTRTTELPAVDAIKRLTSRGVRSFVYTDVSRDGKLIGPRPRRRLPRRRCGPRPLPVLGRDRLARRPPRAGQAPPGQSRRRDRRQVALREEVHRRRGPGRPRRRLGSARMSGLVVYGASGHGREIMSWVDAARAAGWECDVLGFVDDDPATHGSSRVGHAVQGGFEWLERSASRRGIDVVLGVGAPAVKRRLVERLRPLGVSFPAVVHPAAVLTPHVTIGEGVTVAAGVSSRSTSCSASSRASVTRARSPTMLRSVRTRRSCRERTSRETWPWGRACCSARTRRSSRASRSGRTRSSGAGATVVRDLPANCTAVGTPAVPLSRR